MCNCGKLIRNDGEWEARQSPAHVMPVPVCGGAGSVGFSVFDSILYSNVDGDEIC